MIDHVINDRDKDMPLHRTYALSANPYKRGTMRYCYACGLRYPVIGMAQRLYKNVPVGEPYRYYFLCSGCAESEGSTS